VGRPVGLTLHPVFAMTSAGLVLVTIVNTSVLLSLAGGATLAVTLITWWLYSRRLRD